MTLLNYSQFHYWSSVHGGEVLRMGLVGSDGQERHVIIPIEAPGQEIRRRKQLAREVLESAIRRNLAPGEVIVNFKVAA